MSGRHVSFKELEVKSAIQDSSSQLKNYDGLIMALGGSTTK